MKIKLKKKLIWIVASVLAVTMAPSIAFAAPTEGDWSSEADTSWYVKDRESFTISSAEELAGLAAIVNGTDENIEADNFKGKTITLGASIDLSGGEWDPIGITEVIEGDATTYEDHPFSGTFDGNGKTIKGLTITSENKDIPAYRGMNTSYEAYGLFGGICGGTVKDIVFTDVNINNPGSNVNNNTVGAAAGAAINGAVIEGVVVESGSVTGNSRAAGIVGFVGGPNDDQPAKIMNNNTVAVKDCANKADVVSGNTGSSHGTAGGICATANTYNALGAKVTFEGNENTGAVQGYYGAGILASTFMYYESQLVIEGNTNSGEIVGDAGDNIASAAGIALTPSTDNGKAYPPETGNVKVSVNGNVNNGDVTAENGHASGLISSARFVTFGEYGNVNNGDITGVTAGGISSFTDSGNFANLTNTGDITSNGKTVIVYGDDDQIVAQQEPYAGGIVGRTGNGSEIDGTTCINSGAVKMITGGAHNVGDLAGEFVTGTIKNISDEKAIGAVRVGNGAFTTTFENVFIDEFYFIGGHNQSYAYTIELKNASIGRATLSGQVHTGVNIEVTGSGTIDEFILDGIESNDETATAFTFAATNGAQVGTLDATAGTTKINMLRVAANDNGHIDTVDAKTGVAIGYVLTQKDPKTDEILVERVFANDEDAISVVKTTEHVTCAETVAGEKDNTPVSNSMSEAAIHVTGTLSDDAKAILAGTSTGKFTGVELIADATVSGEQLTIAAGKTLILNDAKLTVADNAMLTNNGEIAKINNGDLVFEDTGITKPAGTGTVTTPATSVSINQADLGLCPGTSEALTAVVGPEGADADVTWVSRNTDVATVDASGNVTAVGEGTAVIAALVDAGDNGVSAVYDTVKVTVGHAWAEAWSSDADAHWHDCTRDSCTLADKTQKDGYEKHSMEFVIVTPATETEDGLGHDECSVCGYEGADQMIPATGSAEDPQEPTQGGADQDKPTDTQEPGSQGSDTSQPTEPQEPAKDKTSATGDDSNIALWAALMAAAAAVAAGTVIYSRKKRAQ